MANPSPPSGTATPPRPFRHIPELDGIRGIAAVMVFFHHTCSAMFHPASPLGWASSIRFLSGITRYWDSGVDLFFVLSGFLITSILLTEKNSSRYYREFYIKRALRILPLYLVMLLFVLFAYHDLAYVLLALAFVVNFDSVFHIAGTGPFWTLAIEEQFYLLWPTVVRRLTLTQIRRCSILLGIAAMLLRFAFAAFGHHNYHLTFLRCDGLAFGAFLACHFSVPPPDAATRRRFHAALFALAAAGIALLAALCFVPYSRAWPPLWQTGVVLLSGSIIGLSIDFSGAALLRPLRSRLLTFFGLISYAFYMVHIYVIAAYDRRVGQLSGSDVPGFFLRLAVTFAAAVALSVASRYLLELPAMCLRKRFLRHPNRTAESEHPPLPLARM